MSESLREKLAGIKRTSNPLHCLIDPCPRGEDCFECELDCILAAVVEWGTEWCTEHQKEKVLRFKCSYCWQALRQNLGEE